MLIQSRRASLERSGLCLRWFVLSWRVIRWAQLIRDRSTRGSFLSKIDMRILKKVFVCINIRSIGFNEANVGIPVPTFLPWSCSPLLTSAKDETILLFLQLSRCLVLPCRDSYWSLSRVVQWCWRNNVLLEYWTCQRSSYCLATSPFWSPGTCSRYSYWSRMHPNHKYSLHVVREHL